MEYFNLKRRKLIFSFLIIILVFIIGAAGFMILKGWSYYDAIFFTLVTLSTVGYTIPETVSQATKIFTTLLIFSGITVVIYSLTNLTSFIVEGEIKNFLGVRKMLNKIKRMDSHCIVVGAGKTGTFVIRDLINQKKEFVVIEKDEEVIKKLREKLNSDFAYVIGDIKDEDVFVKSALDKTELVILTLPSDVDNVFAALTVKSINKNIKIISKASEPESVKKMYYAGIDKIVIDSEIIGSRLSILATNPYVVNFLDSFLKTADKDLKMEEIEIPENSWMINKSLKEIALPKIVDLIVISIIKNKNENIFNPGANTILNTSDKLIVLGEEDKIEKLIELVNENKNI